MSRRRWLCAILAAILQPAMSKMTVRLDPITDEALESRLHYDQEGVFAILHGSHVSSGVRLKLLVCIYGVHAARIFGELRAIRKELEEAAERQFALGFTDMKLWPVAVAS